MSKNLNRPYGLVWGFFFSFFFGGTDFRRRPRSVHEFFIDLTECWAIEMICDSGLDVSVLVLWLVHEMFQFIQRLVALSKCRAWCVVYMIPWYADYSRLVLYVWVEVVSAQYLQTPRASLVRSLLAVSAIARKVDQAPCSQFECCFFEIEQAVVCMLVSKQPLVSKRGRNVFI